MLAARGRGHILVAAGAAPARGLQGNLRFGIPGLQGLMKAVLIPEGRVLADAPATGDTIAKGNDADRFALLEFGQGFGEKLLSLGRPFGSGGFWGESYGIAMRFRQLAALTRRPDTGKLDGAFRNRGGAAPPRCRPGPAAG